MDCFLEHAKPTDNINYDFCFSQIIQFPQTTKILGDNDEVTCVRVATLTFDMSQDYK